MVIRDVIHKTCLNLPRRLWEKLCDKAKENQRTATGELITILEAALND